jgi:hypothetical protein
MGLDDSQLERMLRDGRPSPRPEFVRELEATLHASVARRTRRGRLTAAVAMTGFLAATAAVLGLAGGLPSGTGAGDPAEADRVCRELRADERLADPSLTVDADGQLRIRVPEGGRPPVTPCP